MMPVPTIPRQAGGFNAEDCSNLTATDLRDEALKTWSFDKARSRFAKVVINRQDIVKTKPSGILRKPILTALAFEIMHNLDRARLPNIHNRSATEVIRGDFVVQGRFLPSSSVSVPTTLSNRSAKTCCNSRCLSTGTGTGSSN
jgi:hypothetical protein